MKTNHRNALIGAGIAVGVLGYLAYLNNRNKKYAAAFLEYINTLPSQVDLNAAAEQGIKGVEDTKLRVDRLVIKEGGKILVGSAKQPEMKAYLAKYVQELHTAMAGAGTDTKKVFEILDKIRTKNTLKWVDSIYRGVFGEGLFEAMKKENALNSYLYSVFSDKTKYDISIPFLSEGKWHPALADYLNKLPTY